MVRRAAERAVSEIRRLPGRLQGKHRINDGNRGVLRFIDVGSAGPLPTPWREHAYLISRLLKFEPLDPLKTDSEITTLDVAVWERDEDRDFYVSAAPHGASLLRQNFGYVRENFATLRERGPAQLAESWFERSEIVRVERVSCRALDGVLDELDERFDFLKIDAQGAEHQILRGADRFLREDCKGMHLELFTIPLYKGIALLPEVSEWLGEYGFALAYKAPAHGTFDSQHDCLFLKQGNSHAHDAIRTAYGLPRS